MPTTGIWPLRRGSTSSPSSRLSFFLFMQQRTPEAAVCYHARRGLAIAHHSSYKLGILLVFAGPPVELIGQAGAAVGTLLLGHAPGQRRAFPMRARHPASP